MQNSRKWLGLSTRDLHLVAMTHFPDAIKGNTIPDLQRSAKAQIAAKKSAYRWGLANGIDSTDFVWALIFSRMRDEIRWYEEAKDRKRRACGGIGTEAYA